MALQTRVPAGMSTRRAFAVRCAATTTVAPPKASTKPTSWLALNCTKNSLTSSLGGETTRNVDGVVYHVSYDAAADAVLVVDRRRGVRFPTAVDDQNRLRIDTSSPLPHPVPGFSAELYAPLLRGDAPGAETINGRAAMVGFLGLLATEVSTHASVASQLTSPAGAAAAAALAAATLAASLAPAVAGRVPSAAVLPSDEDSFPDGPLPSIWNYLAEKINGRVAMVGAVGLLLTEQFARGGASLL